MDGQGYVFACESGKVERDEVVGMLACQADIEGGAGLSVPDHDGYPAFGRIVLYGKEEEPFLYVQCDDVLFACQMSDRERRVGWPNTAGRSSSTPAIMAFACIVRFIAYLCTGIPFRDTEVFYRYSNMIFSIIL